MVSSASLRSRRSCAQRRSDTLSSTQRRTGPGRIISAAWSWPTVSSCSRIRSLPNEPCARSSRPPTSAPSSRKGGPVPAGQGLRASLRALARGAQAVALSEVARGEPRRHAALPRPAPARGRDDQDEPAEAHRPGHGLAVLQRVEERAEGIGVDMLDLLLDRVTRRRFLGTPPLSAPHRWRS